MAKLDATGAVQWVTTWGGSDYEDTQALAVASDGTAYFGGSFTSADAPGLIGGPYVKQDDWFVAQVDAAGSIQWIQNGGTIRHDRIRGMAVTADGDVVVTGGVNGDFYDEQLFLASYQSNGTPRFELSFPDGAGGKDKGEDVVVDANGDMIVVGSFEGELNLCSEILYSAGENDGFVIRLRTPDALSTPDASTLVTLHQNHPNPFNPSTTIRYRLAQPGPVAIDIFDVAGRHVRQLIAGPRPAGEHSVRWDGRDEAGKELASGVYLYQLVGAAPSESRSMVLVR